MVHFEYTACGHRIAHKKWKETKLQPGTAGQGIMLGCCLVSFHFLWAVLNSSTVHIWKQQILNKKNTASFCCSVSLDRDKVFKIKFAIVASQITDVLISKLDWFSKWSSFTEGS